MSFRAAAATAPGSAPAAQAALRSGRSAAGALAARPPAQRRGDGRQRRCADLTSDDARRRRRHAAPTPDGGSVPSLETQAATSGGPPSSEHGIAAVPEHADLGEELAGQLAVAAGEQQAAEEEQQLGAQQAAAAAAIAAGQQQQQEQEQGEDAPKQPSSASSSASSGSRSVLASSVLAGAARQLSRTLRWRLPDVPWALNTTITLMVLWLLFFYLSVYKLVPTLLRWAGVSHGAAAAPALRHFTLDSLQVAGTVLLLWRGLAPYCPRELGLFAAPLRPLRGWVPAVAAGLAAFPLVDWLYKRMVDLLAAEEMAAASHTAEFILSTPGDRTQALWFLVLAVCAPVWEEITFRGFLLPSLARYLPRWGALAATSLLFAMVHFSREGLLPLLLLGCVLGGAYAATNNLLAPVVLHSLWNVCVLVQLLGGGVG